MNTVVKFPTAVGRPWEALINDIFAPNFAEKSFNPAVNITEKEDGFHVQVVAPGFAKTNLKVTAENDLLKIMGTINEETEPQNGKVIRKDFAAKAFTKSFNLDAKVKTDSIGAKYEDGILNIWLPKVEPNPKVVLDVAVN
jgi:HSP20 family protein